MCCKQAPTSVGFFIPHSLPSRRSPSEDKQNFVVDVCGQLLLTYEKYIQRTGWLVGLQKVFFEGEDKTRWT